MVLGTLDSHMQKNETGPFLYAIHNNKLKWAKNLKLGSKSIKILEENTARDFFDLTRSNFWLDRPSKGREGKGREGKARETKTKMSY